MKLLFILIQIFISKAMLCNWIFADSWIEFPLRDAFLPETYHKRYVQSYARYPGNRVLKKKTAIWQLLLVAFCKVYDAYDASLLFTEYYTRKKWHIMYNKRFMRSGDCFARIISDLTNVPDNEWKWSVQSYKGLTRRRKRRTLGRAGTRWTMPLWRTTRWGGPSTCHPPSTEYTLTPIWSCSCY